MRKQFGFTLIELLVVILILAILMAIALPLYLRAVRDSNRQTCRSNMQTIANALQAFRVRDADHWYPGLTAGTGGTITDFTADDFLATDSDMAALPQCPTDSVSGDSNDYTAIVSDTGQITIMCNSDSATEQLFHNDINDDGTAEGFQPGIDAS